MREVIEAALRRMRPLECQVLLMSSSDDLTYEEIAATLRCSVKDVERLLARAIVQLDRHLHGES
jgi:RNA polymerase sigma factor (sigma-70 family)